MGLPLGPVLDKLLMGYHKKIWLSDYSKIRKNPSAQKPQHRVAVR